MAAQDELRKQLLYLLRGGGAHMSLAQAVADFPPALRNQRPPHVSYSFWHLLEHIRIAQADILDFIQNPDYQELPWPEGYWPPADTVADEAQWQQTLQGIEDDLVALQALVEDPETDLTVELAHAPGYTVLREILLVADHNAYHLGEFAILRQVMQAWP